MPRHYLLLLLLSLASAATAQTSRTLPDNKFERIWAGNNGSGVPLGENKCIVQSLFDAPLPANGLITSVGFRRNAGTSDYAGFAQDFEIVLSATTVSTATLSSVFASNLGPSSTAVLPRTVVQLPPLDRNAPPSAWLMFPITTPWLFAGPNLVVQCKSFAAVWAPTGLRNDRTAPSTTGEAISFGGNCGTGVINSSSTAPLYMPGSTMTLSLTAAPVLQPAALLFGNDLTAFGAAPLPLDLTVLGMPGCRLHVAPLVTFATQTDAAGTASVGLPIPAGTPSLPVTFQWFYGDPSAPGSLPVSGTIARYVQVGPRVPGHSYVYDLFDETVATGTIQGGGPLVRLLTFP